MQIPADSLEDPPSSNSTVLYDHAECGNASANVDGDIVMEEAHPTNSQSQFGYPTYYGPIPVYDIPFAEQMGGGTRTAEHDMGNISTQTPTKVPWNFRQHVPLTPQGSNNPETLNFARCRAENNPLQPPDPAEGQVNDFLNGLDDDIISSLACDRSSSFSSLKDEEGPAADKGTSGTAKDSPVSFEGNKPAARSLLEDFYIAGEYEDIILPPGPKTSMAPRAATLSPTLSSNDEPDPFLLEPIYTGNSPKKPPPPTSDVSLAPYTPLSKPSTQNASPSEGRPSHTALKQCEESFLRIEEIFVELAHSLQWPVLRVKKMFFSGMKGSRSTNGWNLYQAYFTKHREAELKRAGLKDGTGMQAYIFRLFSLTAFKDKECWPSFQKKHGDATEAILRAALDLDRLVHQKETLQQRSRHFQKHCAKLEKLVGRPSL